MKTICHNFYRKIIFNASALNSLKIHKDTKIIREKQYPLTKKRGSHGFLFLFGI